MQVGITLRWSPYRGEIPSCNPCVSPADMRQLVSEEGLGTVLLRGRIRELRKVDVFNLSLRS